MYGPICLWRIADLRVGRFAGWLRSFTNHERLFILVFNYLLHFCTSYWKDILLYKFKIIWKSEYAWNVRLSFKKKDCTTNYRPSLLVTNFSKINKIMISFVNKFGLLSPRQFGIREKTSTEDAILFLTYCLGESKALTLYIFWLS